MLATVIINNINNICYDWANYTKSVFSFWQKLMSLNYNTHHSPSSHSFFNYMQSCFYLVDNIFQYNCNHKSIQHNCMFCLFQSVKLTWLFKVSISINHHTMKSPWVTACWHGTETQLSLKHIMNIHVYTNVHRVKVAKKNNDSSHP